MVGRVIADPSLGLLSMRGGTRVPILVRIRGAEDIVAWLDALLASASTHDCCSMSMMYVLKES
jgi:hypothetical protein